MILRVSEDSNYVQNKIKDELIVMSDPSIMTILGIIGIIRLVKMGRLTRNIGC